jgi:hypothetical protein
MDQFARIVVGYHGCTEEFARELLLGNLPIREWRPSANVWDWLGHGIYFWEHSPERALRWARERYRTRGQIASVIGGVVQLGRCFDLLNEEVTAILADRYHELARTFADEGRSLPRNRGRQGKRRDLDCLVINHCLDELQKTGTEYDTVRGAFLEGKPAYPGAGFSRESHIPIAVRNSACILRLLADLHSSTSPCPVKQLPSFPRSEAVIF